VNNFDEWCTLTVNGETQTAASGTYTFDAGTVVPLTAVGNPTFTFNFWTGTDGANNSSGHDPNASTTVTMTASKQVLACCDNATERCVSSPGYP
jgi:Divergent InlB B-repeat domain